MKILLKFCRHLICRKVCPGYCWVNSIKFDKSVIVIVITDWCWRPAWPIKITNKTRDTLKIILWRILSCSCNFKRDYGGYQYLVRKEVFCHQMHVLPSRIHEEGAIPPAIKAVKLNDGARNSWKFSNLLYACLKNWALICATTHEFNTNFISWKLFEHTQNYQAD